MGERVKGRMEETAIERKKQIKSHKDLEVFQRAMSLAMDIFEITKRFPREEQYSLTDQCRRSSRSVCANIGEAWRKRRYKAAFISKLSDAETEAGETQVWMEIAYRCRYISESELSHFDNEYNHVISQLIRMIDQPEKWSFQV